MMMMKLIANNNWFTERVSQLTGSSLRLPESDPDKPRVDVWVSGSFGQIQHFTIKLHSKKKNPQKTHNILTITS